MDCHGNTKTQKGNFTRLFNNQVLGKPHGTEFSTKRLLELAEAMQNCTMSRGYLSAGYTYLAQFVAHDITHLKDNHLTSDAVPVPTDDLVQMTTPSLDLSSVYGNGFWDKNAAVDYSTGKMLYGFTQISDEEVKYGGDLPRHDTKLAHIPDKRNDDHLIIAQLHLQFLELHNLFIDKLFVSLDPQEAFESARRNVTLYYQEVVIYDLLTKLVAPETFDEIIINNNDYLFASAPHTQIKTPVEFSGAAFRFGHSMVQPVYTINNSFNGEQLELGKLMQLSGKGGLEGERFLHGRYKVEWDHFFNFQPQLRKDKPRVNKAKPVNPEVTFSINVPGNPLASGSLASKNLLRGNQLGLDSAQQLIKEIRGKHSVIPEAVKPEDLSPDALNPMQSQGAKRVMSKELFDVFAKNTPLWYFILAEAHDAQLNYSEGQYHQLGKLGSLIVAETIKSLAIHANVNIFENVPNRSLITETGTRGKKSFANMTDLLRAIYDSKKPKEEPKMGKISDNNITQDNAEPMHSGVKPMSAETAVKIDDNDAPAEILTQPAPPPLKALYDNLKIMAAQANYNRSTDFPSREWHIYGEVNVPTPNRAKKEIYYPPNNARTRYKLENNLLVMEVFNPVARIWERPGIELIPVDKFTCVSDEILIRTTNPPTPMRVIIKIIPVTSNYQFMVSHQVFEDTVNGTISYSIGDWFCKP